jgi:hypothetical protein
VCCTFQGMPAAVGRDNTVASMRLITPGASAAQQQRVLRQLLHPGAWAPDVGHWNRSR